MAVMAEEDVARQRIWMYLEDLAPRSFTSVVAIRKRLNISPKVLTNTEIRQLLQRYCRVAVAGGHSRKQPTIWQRIPLKDDD